MMTFVLPIVLLAGYFTGSGTPAVVKYAPELCGVAASAYIVIRAVRYGFSRIRIVYWVLIVLLALHLLFGIIANQVQPGTVIIGGRLYLRTIPFFLLAITIPPTEATLKKHFLIILGIALLQLPIATYQKIFHYKRALTEGYVTMTGDWVVGTLGISSFLSIFLIGVTAVVVSLYARKVITASWTVGLVLLVLAPTMINETKATFLLAPLVIGIAILAGAGEKKFSYSIKAIALMAGFIAVFVPIYDYFIMPRWGYGLVDFFLMEGRLEGYLDKGTEVGTTEKTGRIDSMRVAFQVLSRDPSSFVFGFGIGSVTESAFGPQFQGEYYSRYGAFGGPTYARLFWEIGFLGAFLVLMLMFLIFNDARRLYKEQTAHGVVGHAYLAIVPFMIICMMYKNLLMAPAIGVCFWYYCGVVAAAATSDVPQLSPAHSQGSQQRPRKATSRSSVDQPAHSRHRASAADSSSTRRRTHPAFNR